MKEAVGELNSALVVIMAVGVLSAFFFTFMWPVLKEGMENRSKCSDAICDKGFNDKGTAYCYAPKDITKSKIFECPFRG